MTQANSEGHPDHNHELAGECTASNELAVSIRVGQLETALEDLQTRFVFQEDTLLQLDDALVAQRNTIDRLQKMLADFVDKVDQQLHERQGGSSDHERPPHY